MTESGELNTAGGPGLGFKPKGLSGVHQQDRVLKYLKRDKQLGRSAEGLNLGLGRLLYITPMGQEWFLLVGDKVTQESMLASKSWHSFFLRLKCGDYRHGLLCPAWL